MKTICCSTNDELLCFYANSIVHNDGVGESLNWRTTLRFWASVTCLFVVRPRSVWGPASPSVYSSSFAIGLLAGIVPAVPDGSVVSWNLKAGLVYNSDSRFCCLFLCLRRQQKTRQKPMSEPRSRIRKRARTNLVICWSSSSLETVSERFDVWVTGSTAC